ncbi:nucleoporin 62 like [Mastacembelus armatus]|uniref:nucleoporin 62 like n=1 Tax=Mastacembelus armatus TaxID=205130 RepID=UPI000E45DB65|nr:nuclear pore glycoprotein p62 [Mastacembelus armatus]
MSGGFNFGQPSTSFSFGAQKTTAPATGTAFGLTSSTPAASGGGFTFGSSTQAATNATGSFSFGTPAKGTAPGTGFSFGTPTTTFGLGTTPQTTTAAGLTLGSTTAPAAGSGFILGGGLSTQTTAAAPAGGGFSFGTAPQSQPQAAVPAAPAAAAAAAAATSSGGLSFGGFSFGTAKVQMTTAAASTAATGGGFSFGTSAPSTLTQPQSHPHPQPASTAPSTTGQGGGFSFGIKPSSTPAPPASSQPAPASVSSLFALPISTAAAPATATGFALGAAPTSAANTAAATTTAGSGGLSFMLKPLGAATTTSTLAPASTAPAAAVTSAATGFTLGLKPASGTSTTTAATATTITTTTTPPVMTYAQLEALINKWSLELEDQERHFLQQATQVNAWDRMLVENGEKITALHKEMEKVKLDQRRLNQELDFILSQQKELEDLLCPLEESVKEQSGTIYMQNADEERERTYKLAENVDAQLKRMSQDLKEIIEHLNTSSGPADTSDPLQQICKILNAHMDSLQWIDQNSVLLQRRVEEVSKLCDNQRKEQEKTFRLAFD